MGTAARDLMEQEEEEEDEEEEDRDDEEELSKRTVRNGVGHEESMHRCRICAKDLQVGPHDAGTTATSIFGEDGTRRSLQKLIHKYLNITISTEDRLPKTVCTTCVGKLDGIHAFATMALRSQEKLRQELLRTSVDSAVTVDSSDSSDSTSNKIGDRSLLHSILTKGSTETPIDGESTQVRQRTPSTEEMEVKVDPMLFLQCAFDQPSSAENSDCSEDFSDKEMSSYGSQTSEALPLTARIRNRIKNKGRTDRQNVNKRQRMKIDKEEKFAEGWYNETEDEDELEDGVDESDRSHVCKICARAFGTQIGLQNHLWSHLPTSTSGSITRDQEQVDVGEVAANSGDDLMLQNNSCNEQNLLSGSFICPICGKKISTKGNLKVHLETHRPKGKYGCDICGRVFKTQSNLFRHKEYHSGVQFPCSVCGRVYPTNSTLRAHSITHSDLRPHACPLCDKTFKRNQDLKFHINQHTGARPYQCPYCPKAFASSGNCFSHRKRMHPKEVNRDRQRAADLMR